MGCAGYERREGRNRGVVGFEGGGLACWWEGSRVLVGWYGG